MKLLMTTFLLILLAGSALGGASWRNRTTRTATGMIGIRTPIPVIPTLMATIATGIPGLRLPDGSAGTPRAEVATPGLGAPKHRLSSCLHA